MGDCCVEEEEAVEAVGASADAMVGMMRKERSSGDDIFIAQPL